MEKIAKRVINIILFVAFLTLIICMGISKKEEAKIRSESIVQQAGDSTEKKLVTQIKEINQDNIGLDKEKVEKSNTREYPKVKIEKTYKGYDVCAKLEIPSISLVTNVLKNYSTSALNVSVTKFWGVDPNQIGNFCVAGHNFKNKNMFRNLKKLNVGDRLFVTDEKIGKVEYEIFDIYKVFPEDTSCLTSSITDEREVTLITCTTDSKQRIIVKAKEV